MDIRVCEETGADVAAIYRVTKRAFAGRPYAGGDEQELVDRLRGLGVLSLSLVAHQGDAIVGQVTFSQATLEGNSALWFALGPVSVDPDHQGNGIGTMLIHSGLDWCRDQGASGCILTGNPDYYQRFGFRLCPEHVPERESVEFFMLLRFDDGPLSGQFAFHPAFYE